MSNGKTNGNRHSIINVNAEPETIKSPVTKDKDEKWRVTGHIRKANGEPVQAVINAVSIMLHDEVSLGQVLTKKGAYVIEFAPPSKRRPDIQVRAYQNDELVASSDVVYNAGSVIAIDLVINNEALRGPSEYDRLQRAIAPHLDDSNPALLKQENVEYLANKTGIDKNKINLFVQAHRQAALSKTNPEISYACFRKGLFGGLQKFSAVRPAITRSRINNAIKQNIIEPKSEAQINNFLLELNQSSIDNALTIDDQNANNSLGKLMTMIDMPKESQRLVLDIYTKRKNGLEAFWKEFASHKTLGKYADMLRLAIKVSTLTQHFEPATRSIMAHAVLKDRSDISRLANLSSLEWEQLVKRIGKAPANIPGDGEEQLRNYARLMENSIINAFPTQHVGANISRSEKYQKTELPKFFDIASDFSFTGTNIPKYVSKLNGNIQDKDAVIKDLSKLQRLYYMAPSDKRFDVMETLDNAGLNSALQVKQYGKKSFVNIFSRKFGSETIAAQVFSKASFINSVTITVAMQYKDIASVLPYVLQSSSGTKPEETHLPDLSSLFGGQSFCSCTHCRSVYGAAAYLVDLLSFLNEHYAIDVEASTTTDTVYKEDLTGLKLLFERRSDIGDIMLNCENTHTLIPYIDIVNEVLENAVVSSSAAYQTTSTTDELKANPEHINKAAYDLLMKEIFPFTQPFSLWNEEAAVYLEHLGVPRQKLIESFQLKGTVNEPDDKAKHAAHLHLSENSLSIITGEVLINNVEYKTQNFWGVTDEKWRQILRNVRVFIDKARISYEELLQLLQISHINPSGNIAVKFAEDAPCDIEQAILAYWDDATQSFDKEIIKEAFFADAHRFFRLLMKTPWSIAEFGKVLDSLEVKQINNRFIQQASTLIQVCKENNIRLLDLLAWWSTINTHSDQNNIDDRSFYAQQFLNKTVFDPKEINESTFVFALNEAGTELNVTTNKISDYLNEISAALNISSTDLLLLTATILNTDGSVNDDLNIKNLSQLYRMSSVAKSLDISIDEYLLSRKFVSADPFNKNRPEQLPEFVSYVRQVKESAFSFKELQYLLLNEYNSTEGIAPTIDKIISLFIELQDGLIKIKASHDIPRDENNDPIDPTGELCKQKLALVITPENIEDVVSIVEATALTPEIEANAATSLFFIDTANLLNDFFSSPTYSTPEARYSYILDALVEHLIVSESRSFIIQAFSNNLSLDLISSEILLTAVIRSTEPANQGKEIFAIENFMHPDFAYDLQDPATYDVSKYGIQQNTFIALYKAAMLINKFAMNAEEVSWTFAKTSQSGWLNPNLITGTPHEVFAAWVKMENFFRMRSRFTEGDISFFDLMDYAADPSLIVSATNFDEAVDALISSSSIWNQADRDFLIFLNLLSELTGWEIDSLIFLASSQAHDLKFEDFKDERVFCQLMNCFDILQKLGATASDAWSWVMIDLNAEQSSNIKQTAKAKYSETEWLQIAAPLRDVLRERQRDALTALLIHKKDFKDENALYEHYLMDVEMSACALTSRIVLANSSVQLFVQRHLMNLEEEILDLDAERWAWMKNYRVWEANRKVFLYPENWIEPELRPARSEFFDELQNTLLQNDVTADLVETSLMEYLEKLDAVSNIEVCGTYYQYEAGDGATAEDRARNTIESLHVFGKTIGVPHEYFYRRFVDDSYWTPWNKVKLDIQGNHLLPVVLNRRLYLFWPEFTSNQRSVTDIFSDETLESFAVSALEKKYSIYYSAYPTYEELVEEYGEASADIWDEFGLTQEKQRAIYINAESIEEKLNEISGINIDHYNIRLSYSEYKEGKWLSKKTSIESLPTDSFWIATELLNGYELPTADVIESVCFHTSIQSTFFEINCTQKLDLQSAGLLWNDQGRFKFYFDKKEITAEDTGLFNSIMEPTGTGIHYNSFREETSSKLELITADVTESGNFEGNESYHTVLDTTPGIFKIPIPHQYNEFVSQTDFFFADDYRNFFVKPYRDLGISTTSTHADDFIAKDNIGHVLTSTYVELGLFNETVYTASEVDAVIFGNELIKQTSGSPVPDEFEDSPVVDNHLLPRIQNHDFERLADTQFNDSILTGTVTQFEYLGEQKYRFYNFYHPYINDFIKALNRDGVQGLLTREMQQQLQAYFDATYLPTDNVHETYPVREIEFAPEGAMSPYNWELFFHVPMLIADRLSKNQQFEEAQKWYHFIFNPTDRSQEASPNKFWQFKPFFELYEEGEGAAEDSIYNLLNALSYSGTDSEMIDKKLQVEKQVEEWIYNPFDPHAIAALRPVAYMKSILMKYIDNLIEWADHLFRQDTIESINEATQLYILAAQILGRRPELISVEEAEARTYNELIEEVGGLDAFSNALVALENVYNSETLTIGSSAGSAELLPNSLYFCIPNNPNLLAYWDTVEDRLFKVRHCMNIEGVVRQLPLFQPPIDPALLVKAKASGLDIGTVLNDLYAPLPHYRYRALIQKVLEFCNDVRQLGNMLLSVLEKRDAEELALIRSGHEQKMMQAIKDVRQLQLEEANENLNALKQMRKIVEERSAYYSKIERISKKEKAALDLSKWAAAVQALAGGSKLISSVASLAPDAETGTEGGLPTLTTRYGGSNVARAADYAGDVLSIAATVMNAASTNIATNALYDRRYEDWKLQEKLAQRELAQIDKQIIAAQIRVDIMQKEVENHSIQEEYSRQVNELIVNKFTNVALYDWMKGQISTVYFQSYQLAYDLAKKAQRCFQFELGSDQTFIEFGYWDSLKKGLLSGEKLCYDIKRMEVAYFEQTKRNYELTKSISLAMLDPLALIQLRETGTCFINLPEVLFDLDYPGHYMRRIKSVQLTLPCVAGPYTSINCKLSLLGNKWRKYISGTNYAEAIDDLDSRFVYNTGGTQSIATSLGQNDSGMFQLNFNDERYLPFEGAGAISYWKLELPSSMRAFDYGTISDVIMQMQFTARDGGDVFRDKAAQTLQDAIMAMALGSENTGLTRMFSFRNEFSNEWYRFLHPPASQQGQQILVAVDQSKFPFMVRDFDITIKHVQIILELAKGHQEETIAFNIAPPEQDPSTVSLTSNTSLGGQLSGTMESLSVGMGTWLISIDEDAIPESLQFAEGDHVRLDKDAVRNMTMIVSYGI